MHVDIDALLQQAQPASSQQLQYQPSTCNMLPDSMGNIAEADSANPPSPAAVACGQLRLLMKSHAQDAAKWDLWAEEDELLFGDEEVQVYL